ncbi:uncharacterized protein LOC6495000 [Drosophila ananassae]|nr:uncharacterized protein LOC6495000 [Drosophila ananassae]
MRKRRKNKNNNNSNITQSTTNPTNVEESRPAPYSEDWRPYLKTGEDATPPEDPPHKPTHNEKRQAAWILRRDFEKASDDEVSPEMEDCIKWAKTIIPDFQIERAGKQNYKKTAPASTPQAPAPSQPPSSKRKDRVECPTTSKRSRMELQNRSMMEMSEGKILLGVLDRGAISGNVPREKWRLVENELQDRFLQFVGDSDEPPPMCTDAGWHQGYVKAIVCEDTRSAEIYKRMVDSLGEVYPTARLVAVDWEQVISPPKARAWVTCKPEEPELILRMLQICNPEIPTANWRVVKVEKASGPTRQVVLLLDNESAEMVTEAGNILRYGFTTIKMKVYGMGRKQKKPPPTDPENGKLQNSTTEERHNDSIDHKDHIDGEDTDDDVMWVEPDED